MTRETDPAFPFSAGGVKPEPGLTIREYVTIEILAKVYAECIRSGQGTPKWAALKAEEAADAWFEQREKRGQKTANGGRA